ncbi:c-type cytochrome [Candidatus Binatus sp.]|uniref:c-type cytochrome n=1 Tax=Candidatus Binatus sp. TaxID=2811406 RepID=UPI003BB0A55A
MAKKANAYRKKSLVMSLALIVIAGSGAIAAQSPAALYSEKCAACHGDSGKGDGPAGQTMTPPPKPFSTALKGRSDSWIGTVITKGGPAVGMTPAMPPHPSLSNDQVAALILYIKGLNS